MDKPNPIGNGKLSWIANWVYSIRKPRLESSPKRSVDARSGFKSLSMMAKPLEKEVKKSNPYIDTITEEAAKQVKSTVIA